jgi:hypothetical protein
MLQSDHSTPSALVSLERIPEQWKIICLLRSSLQRLGKLLCLSTKPTCSWNKEAQGISSETVSYRVRDSLTWFLLLSNADCHKVFLRLLEYYEGILFLTTNRIGSFDKAFKSRIHLAIKYHPLVPSARSKLWELFIRNTYPESNLEWMDKACLERLGDVNLNGREIKNAFRTGHALAMHWQSTLEKNSTYHILKWP